MTAWSAFFLGLFFGVNIGLCIFGICRMAADHRREMEWPGHEGVRVPYKTEPRQ